MSTLDVLISLLTSTSDVVRAITVVLIILMGIWAGVFLKLVFMYFTGENNEKDHSRR